MVLLPCSSCCGGLACYHRPEELAQAAFGDFLWFRFKDAGANLLQRQFRSTSYYTSKSLLCQIAKQPYPAEDTWSSSYVFYRHSPYQARELSPLFSSSLAPASSSYSGIGTGLFVIANITADGLLRVRFGDIEPPVYTIVSGLSSWGTETSPSFLKTRYDSTFEISSQFLTTNVLETEAFILSTSTSPGGDEIATSFGYSGNNGVIPDNTTQAQLTRIGHPFTVPTVTVSPFDLLNQELTPFGSVNYSLSHSISADISIAGNYPSTLGWSETLQDPFANYGGQYIIEASRAGGCNTVANASTSCSAQITYATPEGAWSTRPFLRGSNYLRLALRHMYASPSQQKKTLATVAIVTEEVSEAQNADGTYTRTQRDLYRLTREAFELFSSSDLVPPFGFSGDTVSEEVAIDLWKRQYAPDSQGNIGGFTETDVSDVGSLVVTFQEA